MEEGARYEYAYQWKIKGRATPPAQVGVDVIGAKDIRVIDMKADAGAMSGTFAVTTTKATDPARYDLYINGRLRTDDGDEVDCVARHSVRSQWRDTQCRIESTIVKKISWQVEKRLPHHCNSCLCFGGAGFSLPAPACGRSILPPGLCRSAAEPPKITFLRDVAPILNKVGCTSGQCHGAAKGKNGFKLSLRGYDPQFDYEALLYDLSGRRFNRADPGRSLMLAKPTQEVAHGGGLRFEIGSAYYKTIYDWIAQGVPFGNPATDTVRRLEVDPKEILMKGPGESAGVKVTAIYGDGGSRDVTALAVIDSNIPDVATVADASVKGARTGEATMLLRYQGTFATLPVTVLNPKPGFAWKPLPQNNYIDRAIDAKLQRLKIQPSPLVDDAGFLRRVSLDLTGQLPTPAEARAFAADASKTKRSSSDR